MCRVCGRRGHNHSLMIILTYSTIRMINVTLCVGVCVRQRVRQRRRTKQELDKIEVP